MASRRNSLLLAGAILTLLRHTLIDVHYMHPTVTCQWTVTALVPDDSGQVA
jgi:hypothetical protein